MIKIFLFFLILGLGIGLSISAGELACAVFTIVCGLLTWVSILRQKNESNLRKEIMEERKALQERDFSLFYISPFDKRGDE